MRKNSSKHAADEAAELRSFVCECISDLDRRTRDMIDSQHSRMTKSLDMMSERILSRQTRLEGIVSLLQDRLRENGEEVVTECETDSCENRIDDFGSEKRIECEENEGWTGLRTLKLRESEYPLMSPDEPILTSTKEEQNMNECQPETRSSNDSSVENISEVFEEITVNERPHTPSIKFMKRIKEWCLKASFKKNFWLNMKSKETENIGAMTEDKFEFIEVPTEKSNSRQPWILLNYGVDNGKEEFLVDDEND